MSRHLHDARAGEPDINRDERFDVLDDWIARGLGDVPQPVIERYGGHVPARIIARCRMGLEPPPKGKRIRSAVLNARYCHAYYERNRAELLAKRRARYARKRGAREVAA